MVRCQLDMDKGKKRKFISQEYSTEAKGRNIKEGSRRSRGLTIFAASFFSVAVIIGVCLITFSIMFFFSEVRGTSMMHTLNPVRGVDSDSVLANRFGNARRGDIIIVRHYGQDGRFIELHIKRLIATGGESIHFNVDGNTFTIEVDGIPYNANLSHDVLGNNWRHIPQYADFITWQNSGGRIIPTSFTGRGGNQPDFRTGSRAGQPFIVRNAERNRYELQLPDNYIFYIGDNRGGNNGTLQQGMSADSTNFGPQPASHIYGVVTTILENQTAIQWIWSRFVHGITFRWV